MRFQVNAIFAIHTRQGLVFGCAREIDGDRMMFQVPSPLTPGELLDWRMQLIGRPEMVIGALRVEAQREAPEGEHPLFEGRVVAMSEQNRTLLQSWLIERSTSQSHEPPPALVSASHRKQLTRRSRSRTMPTRGSGGTPTGSERPSPPPAGREAITAALKASLLRTSRIPVPQQRPITPPVQRPADPAEPLRDPPPREALARGTGPAPSAPFPRAVTVPVPPTRAAPPPEPPRPPTPPPNTTVVVPTPPTLARVPELRSPLPRRSETAPHQTIADAGGAPPRPPLAVGPAPPAPQRVSDPSFACRPDVTPVQVRIRYRAPEIYARDWQRHIRHRGIFVPLPDVPSLRARGAPLLIRLDLPSGAHVICHAEVVAPMTQGAGVVLKLEPAQVAVLEQEAARSPPQGG